MIQLGLLKKLERTQDELEVNRAELSSLKETQLKEIEKRCQEVDMMKSQLKQELVNLQTERNELFEQLSGTGRERDKLRLDLEHSSELLEQLKTENQRLLTQLQQVQRLV